MHISNEKEIKGQIKDLVQSIVDKVESEYDVYYTGIDGIVETVFCLILGDKINSIEEMKTAIAKLLKAHVYVTEGAN